MIYTTNNSLVSLLEEMGPRGTFVWNGCIGGVPDVPDIDIVYDQAKLLADNIKKDIPDFYNGCAKP